MFNTKVTSLFQDLQNLWIVNGSSGDKFDGIIIATGTCGRPRTKLIPQINGFKGQTFHSSQLSGKSVKGQRCAVIGGGASAVEAMDFLVKNEAAEVSVIARVSDMPIDILPRGRSLISQVTKMDHSSASFCRILPVT